MSDWEEENYALCVNAEGVTIRPDACAMVVFSRDGRVVAMTIHGSQSGTLDRLIVEALHDKVVSRLPDAKTITHPS